MIRDIPNDRDKRISKRPIWITLALVVFCLGMTTDYDSEVSSVTLDIGHRVHANFSERTVTKMNTREQIGDTDFVFEIVEFYPQFAYVDSTKKIVSLSSEPENPAFKIRVYENGELVEDTWAFYKIKAPHFSPTSYLTFHVRSFEYRGKRYSNEDQEKAGTEMGNDE